MLTLLLIILAYQTIIAAFLIFQTLGGKLVGGKIEEVGFFTGPEIFGFNLGGVRYRLNYIPFGAFVKFTDEFQNLSPIKKIVVALIGLLQYAVVGLIFLGAAESVRHFFSGFGQLFGGVISPIAVGAPLIGKLGAVLSDQSFLAGTGILAMKVLAYNILPFGTLTGGMLVIYVLELVGLKSEKFNEKFQLVGLLINLAILLPWAVAVAYFAVKGS